MDRIQYDFCMDVIRKLGELGVLDDAILVGSWAELFYTGYLDIFTLSIGERKEAIQS